MGAENGKKIKRIYEGYQWAGLTNKKLQRVVAKKTEVGSGCELPPPSEGERNWEWQERILRPHCTGHQHIVCPTRALAQQTSAGYGPKLFAKIVADEISHWLKRRTGEGTCQLCKKEYEATYSTYSTTNQEKRCHMYGFSTNMTAVSKTIASC